MLLGAAVLGAVAGKKFPGVRDAMKALNAAGKVFPNVSSAVLTYIILNLDLPSLLLVVTRFFLQVVNPSSDPRVKKYHDAKYQIFRSLYEQQLSHRSTMVQALQ